MAPTRPAAHASIETAWGQEVHDRVFAAKGVWAHGASRACGGTPLQLDLDTVDADPGGWLNAALDKVVVPAGGAGLYALFVTFVTVNGNSAEYTRAYVYLNGSPILTAFTGNAGGTAVAFGATDLIGLTAGDEITCYANKVGTTNVDASVGSFKIIRITDDFGG